MYISSFQIHNYKSFFSSPELNLTPGFNIIVGQNNVGKTAFIEALSLRFGNNPHRSILTAPNSHSVVSGQSISKLTFVLDEQELKDLLMDSTEYFYVPILESLNGDQTNERFINAITGTNTLKCEVANGSVIESQLESFRESERHTNFILYRVERSTRRIIYETGSHSIGRFDSNQRFQIILAYALIKRFYIFKAERLSIGKCNFGSNIELDSNAANLAEVLNILQSNTNRFRRFNSLVNTILPDVKQISVHPFSNTHVQIYVWTIDPSTERQDLAMPLEQSGTGIGQVLAILYVVLTADYARTIIIDEPQSFLHPGAARKLLQILKEFSQHQFIITTHSPLALTATSPKTLLIIRKTETESKFETINISETQKLRMFLLEIGARLSDVFGADNILWVEGRTEELCFPMIITKLLNKSLLGTEIIGVKQTGDFEGKHKKTAFDIYTRLSKGRGLLPPALGFIFDREGRNATERQDLIRASNETVSFLGRRMYENYLINTQAIAALISQLDGFEGKTEIDVQLWLEANQWNNKYFSQRIEENKQTPELWLENVHAAKILEDIFSELSERTVTFDKVEHNAMLTDWILENSPNDLEQIGELLRINLEKNEQPEIP